MKSWGINRKKDLVGDGGAVRAGLGVGRGVAGEIWTAEEEKQPLLSKAAPPNQSIPSYPKQMVESDEEEY